MSLEDDDYLSDKFLVESTPSKPKVYADRRKEAERLSRLKNEQNRKKSRRLLEQESRAEGLSKSLFDAQDAGSKKALTMMMKMGFKPGQSLGASTDDSTGAEQTVPSTSSLQHKTEPLPITEWEGRDPYTTPPRHWLDYFFSRQEGHRNTQACRFARDHWAPGQDGQDG